MTSKKFTGKISRRKFLMLGTQGAAMATLAACGGQAAAPTAAPAKPAAAQPTTAPAAAAPPKVSGTVEFLAWGDSGDLPFWEKAPEKWKVAYPDLTVKVTPISDPNNNFYPKLQTAIAAGTPPNAASFQGWEWQTYADRGVLAPIDDLVKRDKADAVFPDTATVRESTIRKNQRYLVPLQLATMVMFYSKKLFDDAKVPYPTDDWTFDQFLDTARKLTSATGDKKLFGYQTNNGWFRDIHWIRGTGKLEFDSILDPKKAMFNQPEIAAQLQQVASDMFNAANRIAPNSAEAQGNAHAIQSGNVAMKYEGPWWFPTMNGPALQKDNKGLPFDVVLMPKQADGARPHRGWAEGAALLKTNNIEGGWAVLKWIASEEGQKSYSEVTGRIPAIPSLVESFWIPTVEKNFGLKNSRAFLKALQGKTYIDVVSGVPRSKMWAEVVKPSGWDPMIAGTKKATEVLPDVDAKLNKLLDEYWASQPK